MRSLMVAPPFFRFCYLFGFLTKGIWISDVLLYFDMCMRSEVDDKCCSTYSYNWIPAGVSFLQGTFSHGSKYATDLRKELDRGESSEVQGMLEQWLREKKMSTEEAVSLSASMLIAGIHTVYIHKLLYSPSYVSITYNYITLFRSVVQRHVFGRLSMRSRLDLDVLINDSLFLQA